MKAILIKASAVAVLLSTGAQAQVEDSGVDNLTTPASARCSDLARVEEANRESAIYYVAGYYNGQRDATTIATVGENEEGGEALAGSVAPEVSEDKPEPEAATASPRGILPNVSAEEVLLACAASPDSAITTIIKAHGGVE
jgi:hypothetical protein